MEQLTIYTLTRHDALPISIWKIRGSAPQRSERPVLGRRNGGLSSTSDERPPFRRPRTGRSRSEEHTSELQSQSNLVCRLLLEKKQEFTDPLLTSNYLHASL